MKRESKTNKYGRLMIKHLKAGNEKMRKYYHDKLHAIHDKKMTQQKKVRKNRKYIIVNYLDHTGKVEKSFKQYLPTNNLQSAHDLGEANSRGKVGSL